MKRRRNLRCSKNKKCKLGGGIDKISDLPDHLLGNILCLLPIEDAVKTCVLSSRWRTLWTTLVTNLELIWIEKKGLKKFEGLVDHVLRHCRSSNLEKFHLFFPEIKDNLVTRINGWISSALNRKPKQLILEMGSNVIDFGVTNIVPTYPECILNYNTMVVLKLKSHFKVEIIDSIVSFPCLKTLHFTGWFPYHSSVVHKLVSSSPALEVLHLRGNLEPQIYLTFNISVPTLKVLHLDLRTGDNEVHEHYFTIDTPKLEDLCIKDETLACYSLKNLDSIVSVRVDYDVCCMEDLDELVHINRLFALHKKISSTKHLSLSANSVLILNLAVNLPWPTFSQLKSLALGASIYFDWTLLANFLNNSPKLEHLALHKEDACNSEDYALENQFMWNPPKNVPDCLKLSLKYVKFDSFKGRQDELQLVEYLLNNAHVLDVMEIITHPYPLADELAEKIETFVTASNTCKVYLYGFTKRERGRSQEETEEEWFD